MVLRRKPVPRSQTPSEETRSMQPPVDPNVQRYSLSDPPVLPAINSGFSDDADEDEITRAVDRLLGRHPVESQPHRQQPSPALQPQSINEPTSIAQPPPVHYNGQESKPQMTYKPYQPGQYLAPIMTGETLQIEEANTAPRSSLYSLTPSQDPFHDPTTPLATVSEVSNEQGYYAPSHGSYLSYDSGSGSTLYAGAAVDHFAHDTEAYTSAHTSPAGRRIPRSRSPTPAVDDEDYYLVGNDSFHYTGYGATDPEKAALGDPYDPNGEYARSSTYYSADTPNIVFDPLPETPKSSQFSLPVSETPLETRHFGPAPTGRVLRRHKTKKRVQLTNGNLVVDLKVPPKLVLPRKGEPETMHTRYTAVTCDPDEFEKKGFFLRQNETGRRTELFIVITMYNVRLSFSSIYLCTDLTLGG